ncbi:Ankyrin-3 [Colletotrichum sp. SAR 10_99]|nr:Ankyrin-3 [Colletotrichum sp. SAR 10_99]
MISRPIFAMSFDQVEVEELADALAVNLSESPKFDPAFRMPRPTEICLYCPKASFKITKPASGLYYACLYGLVSEVKSLLSQHVAVNEQGGRQGYPIVVASDKGHIKIVDLLIANGADVNLKDPFDLTALHVAASGGYVEIVQLLSDANAEVNAMTAEYETSLGWACSNGHLKVVRLLLDWGAVMKPPGGMSVNVLQLACSYGHVEIVRLLLNKGADVNGLGEHSESPLESAAAYGDVRIVSLLLQHGASLTLLPNQIGDALESAAAYGDERIMRILLDAGIPVGRSTERDDCASLADEEQDGHAMLALWVAAKNRHVGAVRVLLDAGVGPNNAWAKNNGILQRFYNPHGQQEVEIIKLLLDHGFDVNDSESADESALEEGPTSIHMKHGLETLGAALFSVLVGMGKRVLRAYYSTLAQTPILSDDPLLRAYKMRDWESVQMLLDYGASLDTVAGESCKNHSFLEIVCLDKDMHAVKMLLHRGVDVSLGLPVACYQGYGLPPTRMATFPLFTETHFKQPVTKAMRTRHGYSSTAAQT